MLLTIAVKKFIDYIRCKEYAENTVRGYKSVLRDFVLFMDAAEKGEISVREIKVADLDEYMMYRKDRGDAPVSRNRTVYILRSFFNFLQLKDHVSVNEGHKLESVRYCPQERSYLTREEMEALIGAIDHPAVCCAVMTMAYAGLRISEVCALTLSDVDLKAGIITIRHAKGNKNRKVPINQVLREALRRYLEGERCSKHGSERFFCTYLSGGLSAQYVNRIIADAAVSLRWNRRVSAHMFRHGFASLLIRNNAHISSVQALLGHSDLRVTSRYIHQDLGMLREAVERISADG